MVGFVKGGGMMSYMTVKQLKVEVAEQIKKGNGNKKILISCDDEGNGFHGLFFTFIDDKETIKQMQECCLFHDDVSADDVVILG